MVCHKCINYMAVQNTVQLLTHIILSVNILLSLSLSLSICVVCCRPSPSWKQWYSSTVSHLKQSRQECYRRHSQTSTGTCSFYFGCRQNGLEFRFWLKKLFVCNNILHLTDCEYTLKILALQQFHKWMSLVMSLMSWGSNQDHHMRKYPFFFILYNYLLGI